MVWMTCWVCGGTGKCWDSIEEKDKNCTNCYGLGKAESNVQEEFGDKKDKDDD
jgi:hypothetical protein